MRHQNKSRNLKKKKNKTVKLADTEQAILILSMGLRDYLQCSYVALETDHGFFMAFSCLVHGKFKVAHGWLIDGSDVSWMVCGWFMVGYGWFMDDS